MRRIGLTVVLILITALFSSGVSASTGGSPLFEGGYLDRGGEAILVGPLLVTLVDTQKDYGSGDYYAFLFVVKDGRILNAEYRTILVPDPNKINRLLLNPDFLMAMAETQGYDVPSASST